MKRDLLKDMEITKRATPGPWDEIQRKDNRLYVGTKEKPIADVCNLYGAESEANLQFIAQAREGWPHAIERAIKAEKQLEDLLAWEEPKEKCYLSAMQRIAELESLVRELVDALDFMLGDKSTRTDWLVEMGKTYSKAKEVLGDG